MEQHIRSQSNQRLQLYGENRKELLQAIDKAFFQFNNNGYQQINISAFEVEDINRMNDENNIQGVIDLGPADEYDEGAYSPAFRADTIDNRAYRSTIITDHILERHKLYSVPSRLTITSKEYQQGMEMSINLIPARTAENIIEALDGNNHFSDAIYHIVAFR